ncbi:MAG: saccharopine dehydrogenase C-terminal domain-containing protein [Ginsengibacter sp.]
MKKIVLFGAGKSATVLIDYLGKCSDENNWELIVCDSNLEAAMAKTAKYSSAKAVSIDVSVEESRQNLIEQADIVISMLPPALHFLVAKDCVLFSKNLLTASYLDEKIQSLKKDIDEKGLLFLGEMGLDPGIDHMSAMKLINEIDNKGGKIISFKSHCGGLVSPEDDDNPWHYKVTWNPANVVRAGSSGAVFLLNNKMEEIAYENIFKDDNNIVDIPSLFPFAWYANRDSLSYIDTYHLQGIATFIRTTLRYPSFCTGWNKFVNMELTDNSDYELIKNCKTFAQWFKIKKDNAVLKVENDWNEESWMNENFVEQIDFLELRKDVEIPFPVTSSAAILQYLLEKNLVMKPHDKDMIIMLHEIEYLQNNEKKHVKSCLIVKGEDQMHTAMAKTVGLPLGIAAKLILQNKINLKGLHIPVVPEIYSPVLKELESNGVKFFEE